MSLMHALDWFKLKRLDLEPFECFTYFDCMSTKYYVLHIKSQIVHVVQMYLHYSKTGT